jgi:hypothetical protein
MKMPSAISLVVVSALAVGCSGVPKSPKEFNVSHAAIVPGDNETNVEIAGLPGKGTGVVVGGGTGAGVGVGAAALLCIGSGPWFPLCFATFGTMAGTAGAVGGGVAGAVVTESSHGVETKRNMLTEALLDLDASQTLAPLVYKKSLESMAVRPPQEDRSKDTEVPAWTIRISLDEFATVGSGPDTPYSLQLSASVEIMRLGDKDPAFEKSYQANSPLQMSTVEWRANKDQPVRSVLDDLMATLATEIFNDLKPIQLNLDRPLDNYKVFVKTIRRPAIETNTQTVPVAVLKSKPDQSQSSIEIKSDNPGPPSLFDPATGMNWVVVDSSPVDLSTANNICKTLDAGDKRKYRVPSLNEFEVLWKKYKNDEHIGVFKKREYCTDGKHISSKSAYTQTFSFESGNSGQLYASYLTCVGK